MTMMPDVIEKNDSVMTFWLLPLKMQPLCVYHLIGFRSQTELSFLEIFSFLCQGLNQRPLDHEHSTLNYLATMDPQVFKLLEALNILKVLKICQGCKNCFTKHKKRKWDGTCFPSKWSGLNLARIQWVFEVSNVSPSFQYLALYRKFEAQPIRLSEIKN